MPPCFAATWLEGETLSVGGAGDLGGGGFAEHGKDQLEVGHVVAEIFALQAFVGGVFAGCETEGCLEDFSGEDGVFEFLADAAHRQRVVDHVGHLGRFDLLPEEGRAAAAVSGSAATAPALAEIVAVAEVRGRRGDLGVRHRHGHRRLGVRGDHLGHGGRGCGRLAIDGSRDLPLLDDLGLDAAGLVGHDHRGVFEDRSKKKEGEDDHQEDDHQYGDDRTRDERGPPLATDDSLGFGFYRVNGHGWSCGRKSLAQHYSPDIRTLPDFLRRTEGGPEQK